MLKSGPSFSSIHFPSLPYENTDGPIDSDAEPTAAETRGLQATQMSAFDGFESPPHKLVKKCTSSKLHLPLPDGLSLSFLDRARLFEQTQSRINGDTGGAAPSLMLPEVQAQLQEERKEQEECLESAAAIFQKVRNDTNGGVPGAPQGKLAATFNQKWTL